MKIEVICAYKAFLISTIVDYYGYYECSSAYKAFLISTIVDSHDVRDVNVPPTKPF